MAGRFQVGVQLPEVEREVRWAEVASMARLAEDIGFDSLWVGDHLLYRDTVQGSRGPWECWSQLAALAAITERVLLGPLVASTGFHSPAMLAKKAATVDEISDGRLILGLGAGWNEVEYRAFGFPFDHRVSRFEEAFTIIRTLLREGAIDHSGHYYEARDSELLPRGPRPEGPPLMVGSMGERMLQITMPHVALWNGWYAWFGNDVERLRPILAKVDEACQRVGRDPAEVVRTAAVLVQLEGGGGRVTGDPGRSPAPPLRGIPEELAAALGEYRAVGVEHLQLVLDPIDHGALEALAPVLELLDRGAAALG